MTGSYCEAPPEVLKFRFSEEQACLLDEVSLQVAIVGGPDSAGAAATCTKYAMCLKHSIDTAQLAILNAFASSQISAIEFTGMRLPTFDPVPEQLADMDELLEDSIVLYLASRNQVLLSLVGYRSFAFDIDNDGMQVRLVGNFKGGGTTPLVNEGVNHKAELSSHAGVGLGPHTEPPYNCSVLSEAGHSPAPSALILTARWNPLHEPTRLIPVRKVIAKLNGLEALALSSRSFCFTRSDCFIKDEGQAPGANSILQFDKHGDFTLRYSSYRYSPHDEASDSARHAYHSLQHLLEQAKTYAFVLHPDSALLINNNQTLHAREVIKDNRRLLVRLFAYSPDAQPLVLQEDPLVVRG